MTKKLPAIYLGGGAHTNWRDGVVEALKDVAICYDPIKMSRQHAILDFTSDDMAALRASDYMFMVHDQENQHGASFEAGACYVLDIPYVYVCLLPHIETMVMAGSKAAFTNMEEALEYTKKRLLS